MEDWVFGKLKKNKRRRLYTMKKNIIIILAMVFFIAIPSLASTPTNENMPVPTSEDQQFMGLKTLSEEELIEIIGNVVFHEENDPITINTIVRLALEGGITFDEGITISLTSENVQIISASIFISKSGKVILTLTATIYSVKIITDLNSAMGRAALIFFKTLF
jgi:hypothetical protein